MNVIVQSKTFAVTEALRAFVEKHVTRLFRKRGRISQIVVYLESIPKKKNDLFSTCAKFHIEMPGKSIVVQEKAADLYLAISQAAQSAARQLRKVKERRQQHQPKLAWAVIPDGID